MFRLLKSHHQPYIILLALLAYLLVACSGNQEVKQAIPSIVVSSGLPKPSQPGETSVNLGKTPTVITNTPSPSKEATHEGIPAETANGSAIPLIELSGNLDNQVKELEENAPRPGSNGFVLPDETALVDFVQIVRDILASKLVEARDLAEKYGYELILYKDEGNNLNQSLVLRERSPIQRGWGLFILQPEACSGEGEIYILEAPHILSDEHTPQIALNAFRAMHGCALLVAGAHRDANADGSADVAHNPMTVFQAIHTTLDGIAGESSLFLQFHGFAAQKHPGYPAAVLGGSPENNARLTGLLEEISASMNSEGISTGICSELKWDTLCGDTNVQAKELTSSLFIHLELDELLRSAPNKLIIALTEALPNN